MVHGQVTTDEETPEELRNLDWNDICIRIFTTPAVPCHDSSTVGARASCRDIDLGDVNIGVGGETHELVSFKDTNLLARPILETYMWTRLVVTPILSTPL
ncbi:hypothetical protein BGX26_006198 [Mortierella sp. AD094]|nr:hypothetical protein BGX26_006198 [Mortierella sp. AD094]